MPLLSSNLAWSLANKIWAQNLNPIVSNLMNQGKIIPNISLINGSVTFNHGLGRQMTGWYIVDIQSAATIYRSQPLNALTLTLTSNAAATVAVGVF